MLLSEQLNSATVEHLQVRQRGGRWVHTLFLAWLRTKRLTFRNVAANAEELHNVGMRLADLFGGFLHLIGVGVVIVLALVLGIRLGLPQRSLVAVRRRLGE